MSKHKSIPSAPITQKKAAYSGTVSRSIPASNVNEYYSKHPAWCFRTCDCEYWKLSKDTADEAFWDEILPKLRGFESQTWSNILVDANKQNHPIPVEQLNKCARDRLRDLYIEAEAIISLRLNATHRIYGYISDGPVFYILWYDTDHGDNDTCVCRSVLKHS